MATRASAAPKLTNITLQLKWVPQAQFAGYYAASLKGFYKAEGLNVTLKNGGPNIIPEQVVASGQAQFGVDWLPSLLAARDKGTDLVNVAQVFARSGMTQLTWKSSGINTIAKMRGKKVGNWLGGNQYELFAALTKNGMDPAQEQGRDDRAAAVRHEPVPAAQDRFGVGDDLQRARAGPRVEEPEDRQALHDVRPERDQDAERSGPACSRTACSRPASGCRARRTRRSRSSSSRRRSRAGSTAATTSPTASNMTLKEGPTLPKGHQTWQMNEINKLDLAEHVRHRHHEHGATSTGPRRSRSSSA